MTMRSDTATQIRRAQPGGQSRFVAMLQLAREFPANFLELPQYLRTIATFAFKRQKGDSLSSKVLNTMARAAIVLNLATLG
jgi:hypothetical protein